MKLLEVGPSDVWGMSSKEQATWQKYLQRCGTFFDVTVSFLHALPSSYDLFSAVELPQI